MIFEFGMWNYSGSQRQAYRVHDEDFFVEKCAPNAKGDNIVYLRRLHCTHPSNQQVKRLICFVSGEWYACMLSQESVK